VSAFAFIGAKKTAFDVSVMCEVLGVSRSGFYAWQQRPRSERARRDCGLTMKVRAIFTKSKSRYGAPRVHRALRIEGERVGRKRVARLMRQQGLRARPKRRFVVTTQADPKSQPAPNLLDRKFGQEQPNKVWAGDITYISTKEGWLYLAVLLDLFSRKVVGWQLGTGMRVDLVTGALGKALSVRRPPSGLMHHSDRGSQYTSNDYRALTDSHGIDVSMSRRGDCWDNAVVESFFSSLKTELGLVHGRFDSRAQGRREIAEYIDVFYNHERLHSSLDYVSPVEYERDCCAAGSVTNLSTKPGQCQKQQIERALENL
jgi:putative transposase